jgi:hypothetical protein
VDVVSTRGAASSGEYSRGGEGYAGNAVGVCKFGFVAHLPNICRDNPLLEQAAFDPVFGEWNLRDHALLVDIWAPKP